MRARTLTFILAMALLSAAPLAAQSVQFDLGLGYQWLDVTGNEDVHRTQTGEQEGTLLDSLTLLLTDTDRTLFFDRLRLSASGVGASPYTRVRLDVSRQKAYSFSVSFNRADVFNAVPGIANPFLAAGISPGQHTLDRRRDTIDLDLELLPGRAVTPLVGFSRHRYRGPATTTYSLGNDEFRLDSNLDETVEELRVGVALAVPGWRATLLQGWRSLDSTETVTLAQAAGDGDGTRPFLGRQIFATVLDRTAKASVDTPFTTVAVTGELGGRVRLVSSYVRASAESESFLSDGAEGELASIPLRRFFSGLTDTATGRADSPSWRGEVRLEVTLASWLDASVGYTSSHRSLDGRALLSTSYLGTTTYGGVAAGDVETLLEANTAWERDEDLKQLRLQARPLSWLRLWGGLSTATQEVTITPDVAEIVLPGNQGGTFNREVQRVAGGAEVKAGPVFVMADWSSDDADHTVLRTDTLDRERWRLRAGVKIGSVLRLFATSERIEGSNPTPDVAYDATVEHWSAEAEVTPLNGLVVRGGYHEYSSDSSITIRRPDTFMLEPSQYLEDGDDVEGSVSFQRGRFSVEAGGNRYSNEGDLPFEVERSYGRVDCRITDVIGVYGQYEHHKYSEALLPLADHESDRFGVFLRLNSK